MTDSTTKVPQYSIVDVAETALELGMRAFDDIRTLARQPGPSGKDGRDGRDGLSSEKMDFRSEDGGRYLVAFWTNDAGEIVRETRMKTATSIYRGVYQIERQYDAGDQVTFGGAQWTALVDTADKPETAKSWQLSAKRGQNGKDGRDGRDAKAK